MSARGRGVSLAFVASLAVAASGCESGKREAASLVAAVDRYRKAPMDGKGSLADALEKVACSDAEVCAAKAACVASARPTVHGVAMKHEVEAALDDLNAGRITKEQASALGLSAKLDDASRAIEEGRAKLAACDAQVISLRLKYAL